jgi:hypothetical protein
MVQSMRQARADLLSGRIASATAPAMGHKDAPAP